MFLLLYTRNISCLLDDKRTIIRANRFYVGEPQTIRDHFGRVLWRSLASSTLALSQSTIPVHAKLSQQDQWTCATATFLRSRWLLMMWGGNSLCSLHCKRDQVRVSIPPNFEFILFLWNNSPLPKSHETNSRLINYILFHVSQKQPQPWSKQFPPWSTAAIRGITLL